MENKIEEIVHEIYYLKNMYTWIYLFFVSLIFSSLITIVSMLSVEHSAIATGIKGVSSFYIGITIILISVVYTGWWGILSTFAGSFFFGLGLNYDLNHALLWSLANVIQAILLLLLFRHRTFKEYLINNRKVFSQGFITLMFLIAPFMVLLSISTNKLTGSCISATIVFISYTVYAVRTRRPFIAFIPPFLFVISLLSAFYGVSFSMGGGLLTKKWFSNLSIWTLSNTVIISSLGMFLLYLIIVKNNLVKRIMEKKKILLRVDSLIYLFALIFWNYIFVALYVTDWFSYGFSLVYLSPWVLGFIFFSANFILSQQKELKLSESTNYDEIFAFIEKRAVVAEYNTGTIILVLSILIPVAGTMLKSLSKPLVSVFIITISTACASIGLIWVPQNNIRLMSLIKTVKTVLHLFTICFLLLSAIMLLKSVP